MLDGVSPVIFGDGDQTRDFVYIDDVVEANLAPRMYLGLPGRTSQCRLWAGALGQRSCRAAERGLRNQHAGEYRPPRKGDLVHSVASVEKLEHAALLSRVSLKRACPNRGVVQEAPGALARGYAQRIAGTVGLRKHRIYLARWLKTTLATVVSGMPFPMVHLRIAKISERYSPHQQAVPVHDGLHRARFGPFLSGL